MRAEAVLAAGLLLGGCAAPANELGGGGDEMSGPVAASLEVKLQQDVVRLILHVTNTGDEAMEFTFPSSQRYDFVVTDGAGEEVWRWSDGMMFLQVISEVALGPGETWEFEGEWEPGNRSGRYQVVGRVTAEEHDVQQSATFDLP